MFKLNDNCYVKTSSGYVPCKIMKKQGNYYIVQTKSAAFGATEHRLITVEEYEEKYALQPKPTYYKLPNLH